MILTMQAKKLERVKSSPSRLNSHFESDHDQESDKVGLSRHASVSLSHQRHKSAYDMLKHGDNDDSEHEDYDSDLQVNSN